MSFVILYIKIYERVRNESSRLDILFVLHRTHEIKMNIIEMNARYPRLSAQCNNVDQHLSNNPQTTK
jgi:hypothetical protein